MVAFSRGFNFTHPNRLIPRVVEAANISLINGGTNSASTGSQFFTNLNNSGVAVDSNFSAGVAKQVLSASGRGEILGAVGPTAGGAETTQFIFVLDGATYTSPAYTLASGERAVLWFASIDGTAFTTAQVGMQVAVLDATKSIQVNASGQALPGWGSPITFGSPKLQFDASAVISITHSANVTGTANQERQSGVGYRMLSTWT